MGCKSFWRQKDLAPTPPRVRYARAMVKKKGASQALAVVGEVTLDAPARQVLAEALRRGAEAADAAEDAIVGFGRWLLVHVFADDAAAALDDAQREPRVARAPCAARGGP